MNPVCKKKLFEKHAAALDPLSDVSPSSNQYINTSQRFIFCSQRINNALGNKLNLQYSLQKVIYFSDNS